MCLWKVLQQNGLKFWTAPRSSGSQVSIAVQTVELAKFKHCANDNIPLVIKLAICKSTKSSKARIGRRLIAPGADIVANQTPVNLSDGPMILHANLFTLDRNFFSCGGGGDIVVLVMFFLMVLEI